MTTKDDVLGFIRLRGVAGVVELVGHFPELTEAAAREHLRRLYKAGLIDPEKAAPLAEARYVLTVRGSRRLTFRETGGDVGAGGTIRFA